MTAEEQAAITTALDPITAALVQQALTIPSVRAAVVKEAQKAFLEDYGGPLALGAVLAIGAAFAAGRASA